MQMKSRSSARRASAAAIALGAFAWLVHPRRRVRRGAAGRPAGGEGPRAQPGAAADRRPRAVLWQPRDRRGPNLPDGQYIAFLKPWKDTRNIYVKKTGEPFEAARLVTAEARRPIPTFFWTRDSRLILYVKDNDGDENFNVWAVDPAAAKAEGQEVPPSRNLTDAKGVRAFIYDVPKKAPDTIYVGLNDRDAAWHDLYKVTISTGKRELIRKNHRPHRGLAVRPRGRLRLALRTTDKGEPRS